LKVSLARPSSYDAGRYDAASVAISFGGLLVLLGLGSFVLPLFDYQFMIMSWMEDWQPWAGIEVTALGMALIAWSTYRRRQPSA
jgi:hypothetical protein